jgi:predicted neuraminidase
MFPRLFVLPPSSPGTATLLWAALMLMLSVGPLAGARGTAARSAVVLKSEFVYEEAPFPSCHASTIVETTGKRLVAAWFGGITESDPGVGIYVSRYEKGRWTPPVEVADGVQSPEKRFPCYNPVLFQPVQGPLMLFYKVGPGPQRWWGMMTTSSDQGKTWLPPWRLPDGILGPIKNKPIELADGDILCPSSTEEQGWRVHFERTSDRGKTWTATGPLNDGRQIGAIQPSILSLGGHRLRAVGRTQQGKIFQIDSGDDGRTWEPMQLTDLPNPNSGIDAVTLRDGRFLLVYNATSKGRTPLNVAISGDGKTWSPVLTLESSPGEYSYPAVIQTHDEKVHITYTWNRKRIRHVVLNPKLLRLPRANL